MHRLALRRPAAIVATCAAAGAAVLIAAIPASGAPYHAPAARKAHFTIVGIGEREQVVAHGAITGGGRVVTTGDKDTFHLGGGTLVVKHPNGHFVPRLNSKTCYASYTITGKYTISHGTGRFAGVTGHGSYKVSGHLIMRRTKSGACDQNADPKVEIYTIAAGGPVARH